MSRGINKVILIGHLGAPPELRYTPSGRGVAGFQVATSEKWKDKKSGQEMQHTEWHRVITYGKQAEIASEFLKKGSKVYVEGKLRTRKWTKDGVDHYTTEIICLEFQMLDRIQKDKQGQPEENSPAAAAEAPQADYTDDDIPF